MKSIALSHSKDVSNELTALKNLAADIIAMAKKKGATQCDVELSFNQGFSVSTRLCNVEQIDFNRDKEMNITIYLGKRCGSAGTSDITLKALQKTVDAAFRIAQFTDEDEYSGLADASLMAKNVVDLDLYHPWDLSPQEAIDQAMHCEKVAMEHDARIKNSEGASIAVNQGLYVYGNSQHFIGAYPYTRHSLSCALIAEENDDMQRDYDYTIARDANDLASPEAVAMAACKNTVERLHSRKIKTQKAPVVFINHIANGLIRCFLSAIKGSNLYRESSFLLNKMGQSVFPDFINLYEQPFIPKALGSAPFDSDGLPCTEKHFIRNGILENYLLSVYSARKLNLMPNGNASGAHNLQITTSDKNLPALLKTMGKGLLVTELMGQGVNIVTGDYSQGATGFWVENGDIQFPVSGVTIAGNLGTMFKQIVCVGNDIDRRHNILTGSILLDQMMVAGE